jgi:3-hydroxyisobutyrate dehydrogenase-like beta-hydroxyacid dehydrogenase
MVGSENDPQDSRAWPVLASLGKEPMHMGAVGTAAATKLALNQLIASLTVSLEIHDDAQALQLGCYAAPHARLLTPLQ